MGRKPGTVRTDSDRNDRFEKRVMMRCEKAVSYTHLSHGNREYTANWKAEEKTLKFDPNGGEWEDGKAGILAKKDVYKRQAIQLMSLM